MRTQRTGQSLVIAGGLLAFVMLGWSGLLVPSLIRQIEQDLGATDASMGVAFLLFALAFTIGSLFTGWATGLAGRRVVLLAGVAMLVAGCVGVLVPSWAVFLVAVIVRGFGSGIIEVAIQGLFLASFTGATQGRAINMVHFCYSVGAALAPVAVAVLLGAGLSWQWLIALTAVPWVIAGGLLARAPMDGRTDRTSAPAVRLHASVALVAAAIAIALYVAAEVGLTSWLVRFLAAADLNLAASALTLFWVGLAGSRLLAARFAGHVAPEVLSIGGFLLAAVAIVGAVLSPDLGLSIALFGIAGFAFGPVYAGIILLGARIPGRKDAVTGILASSGVAGSIVYPPLMGFISEGPGLGVAMGGAAVLSVAGAGLVIMSARALEHRSAQPVADAA